jgi:hypothetical protein
VERVCAGVERKRDARVAPDPVEFFGAPTELLTVIVPAARSCVPKFVTGVRTTP